MLKQISILTFAIAMIVVLQSSTSGVKSSGAPPCSTGAPNELTCAQTGCHTGAAINSGTAILNLDFDSQATSFQPNQTYPITVSITDAGHQVFGFELVALDANGNNAGNFVITDANRTQVISGFGSLSSRNYATYKVAGTAATSSGVNQWTVNWQAPASLGSDVTFYVTSISANGDNTDAGDFTFSKSTTIANANPTAISTIAESENILSIFPNPCSDYLIVKGNLVDGRTISVYDLQGRRIIEQQIVNPKSEIVNLTSIPTGIYLVEIKNANSSFTKKITIQ